MYKLMVVDDSNIIRNRIQRAYNNETFMVVATAPNGADAVAFCVSHFLMKNWLQHLMNSCTIDWYSADNIRR